MKTFAKLDYADHGHARFTMFDGREFSVCATGVYDYDELKAHGFSNEVVPDLDGREWGGIPMGYTVQHIYHQSNKRTVVFFANGVVIFFDHDGVRVLPPLVGKDGNGLDERDPLALAVAMPDDNQLDAVLNRFFSAIAFDGEEDGSDRHIEAQNELFRYLEEDVGMDDFKDDPEGNADWIAWANHATSDELARNALGCYVRFVT